MLNSFNRRRCDALSMFRAWVGHITCCYKADIPLSTTAWQPKRLRLPKLGQLQVRVEADCELHRQHKMRWLYSLLLLGILGLAQALSTSGNRLLVVLEDLAEKEKYGRFLGDLKGR